MKIKKRLLGILVKSKLVQLLLIWFFILGINNALLIKFSVIHATSKLIFSNFNNLQFILYPFLGIAMDARSARLKTMKFCVVSTVPGLFIGLCCYILFFLGYSLPTLQWFGLVAFTVPFSLYRTNVVPLYVEQMMEYSSDEVNAVIHWHVLLLVLSDIIVRVISTFAAVNELRWFIAQIIISLVTFFVLPCSYHFLSVSHFTDNPHATNPVKLIFSLIKYTIPGRGNNRSFNVTFSSDAQSSRLDQGKLRYGGPFKEEEVEDVKMVFRVIPILICVLGLVTYTGASLVLDPFLDHLSKLSSGYSWSTMLIDLSIVLFIALNLFVIPIFCHCCLPSMLKRIGIGLLFVVFSFFITALIHGYETFGNNFYNETSSNFFEKESPIFPALLFLIPLISSGIGFCLIVINSLEFVLAQSPACMRGLLIGLWYTTWGIKGLLFDNIHYALKHHEFYYFVGKSIFSLAVLVIYIICAKCYKRRNRIFYASNEHDNLVDSQLIEFGESASHFTERDYGTLH